MTRKFVAFVGAAVILVVVGWLDAVVIVAIQRRSAQSFDVTGIGWALPFGYLILAGAILAIALLGRWAASVLVGVAYAIVGAFLTFLFPITWFLAAGVNGATPVLPEPIATFISNIYFNVEQGPLNAIAILGATLLLVGLATIGQAVRKRVPAMTTGPAVPLAADAGPH